MHYILTLTQSPTAKNPEGNFVYKKESPFAQKISICCNYYNLTIRVVNPAGEQLAIYDAFHEPDKFVDHFVFCSNDTQNRRMDPEKIRAHETRVIKSSGFLIGVSNDQLRTQIQCTGNHLTETPAMVFQSSDLTEDKATKIADRLLSAQKDSVTKGGWDKQVLKPLSMVAPGMMPPFEELPLDLVDCKDGNIYVTGKVVGIFDARAPESPVLDGTFSDVSANNAMRDCWVTARSHAVATAERKRLKDFSKLSQERTKQAESSDYVTKVYYWDEVSRLNEEELTSALKRMHQSYHETGNIPDDIELTAFFMRGINLLNGKDFNRYIKNAPIFANLKLDIPVPERFYHTTHRRRLPTRLGFNYPHEGAFVTTQNLYVNEWGYTHQFIHPHEVLVLIPRPYLAALEGKVATVVERVSERPPLANAIPGSSIKVNLDPVTQQPINQIISLKEIYQAAEKNRKKATSAPAAAPAVTSAAAPVVTSAPTPAIPPAPVVVRYQTAGEYSGFDLIERVPPKKTVTKTVICTKLPTPKLNVQEKLTTQEEDGLRDLLALDLESFVPVAEPESPATPASPPTPPIMPVLSPAGVSLTLGTMQRVDVANEIDRADAVIRFTLNELNGVDELDQLEQDLAWLEAFEPPSKKSHLADY